jgi:hypothetical protein
MMMSEGDEPIDGPIPLTHQCGVATPSSPLPKGEGAITDVALAGGVVSAVQS